MIILVFMILFVLVNIIQFLKTYGIGYAVRPISSRRVETGLESPKYFLNRRLNRESR